MKYRVKILILISVSLFISFNTIYYKNNHEPGFKYTVRSDENEQTTVSGYEALERWQLITIDETTKNQVVNSLKGKPLRIALVKDLKSDQKAYRWDYNFSPDITASIWFINDSVSDISPKYSKKQQDTGKTLKYRWSNGETVLGLAILNRFTPL